MGQGTTVNVYYSHLVWRHLHGASCRCLQCARDRAAREPVPSVVDRLDVVLALWVAEAIVTGPDPG